ncbi:MAG: hypothetical protein ACRDBT_03185 [Aeromonas sp.]
MKPIIEKKRKNKAAQLAAIQAAQASEQAAQLDDAFFGDVAAYEHEQKALTAKREQQLGWLIAMMVILVLTGAVI